MSDIELSPVDCDCGNLIDVGDGHLCPVCHVLNCDECYAGYRQYPKAKRLVWEEFKGNANNLIIDNGSVNMLIYTLTNHLCIRVFNQLIWDGEFDDVEQAKQAAQDWYDNYVAEFIKENCE